MARAVVLLDCMRIILFYEKFPRLSFRDGFAALGGKVAGKHRVTVFVAIVVRR